MNQIGLNSNKIANFRSVQEMQMQQIPQMQNEQSIPDVPIPQIYKNAQPTDKASFKEQLKKADVMGLVYPWIEHPILMAGTCAGLAWGVDKFSSACGGEYASSLVGKAAKLGDNIEESKVVQSKPFQTVLGWGKAGKNKIANIFKNSDVVNSFIKTPSKPEWGFVKDELLTMEQRIVRDFSHVTSKLLNPEYRDGTKYVKLTDLGIDKQEKEFIKKFFNNTSQTDEIISNTIQLKRLGLTDSAIQEIINKPEASELVKAKYFEKLGVDEAFLQKLKENAATKEDVIKVREACKKAKNIRIGAGHQKFLGPVQPFARKIGLDEIGNRLTSMSEAKTATGKAMATFLQKCHRGFTFGGGKMGVLFFVTPLLVETMLDVKKAAPDQKAGTAAHGLVHSVSWVFTFPLALAILHRFGGMQYAGMSKEAVEESRKLIKEFNEKANPYKKQSFTQKIFGGGEKKAASETFQTYEEYKKAKNTLKENLKNLRKNKDQNLLTKICKKVGSFITMDLERISHFRNGSFFEGGLSNIGNKLKNVAGIPLRVGIWAGIIFGALDPLINKCIKGCFGNFYDRFKEEEFEENKKVQKQFLKDDLKARLQNAQNKKVLGNIDSKGSEFIPPENLQKKLNEDQAKAEVEQATKEAERKQVNNNTETTPQDINKNNTNVNTVEEKFDKNASPEKNVLQEKKQDELINQPINRITDTNTYIPAETANNIKTTPLQKRDNYTYIPSSENLIKKDKNKTETSKYIPSQQAKQFTKTFDNSGLDAALRRADRAEQRALQTLAGNFNNY